MAAWLAQDGPCEVAWATTGDIALGDAGGAQVLRADVGLRTPGLLCTVGAEVLSSWSLWAGIRVRWITMDWWTPPPHRRCTEVTGTRWRS